MGKIVVVGLDIPRFKERNTNAIEQNTDATKHYLQSAEIQIDTIFTKIDSICKKLSSTEPNADKWIIAWREYGITNAGQRTLTKNQKKLFKQKMIELTKKYEKLTIIAGSVASMRNITSKTTKKKSTLKKIDVIKSGYDKHEYIENLEQQINLTPEYQTHNFNLKLQDFISSEYDTIEPDVYNFSVIRNTCYIFFGGECISRHDKIAPFKEMNNEYQDVFQSTNSKGNNSYINESIGVEICREHIFSLLAKECKEKNHEPPMIHFLLSDSITAIPKNASGKYLIHFDSISYPALIVCHRQEWEAAVKQVKLYQNNFFAKDDILLEVMPQRSPEVQQQQLDSPTPVALTNPTLKNTDETNSKRNFSDLLFSPQKLQQNETRRKHINEDIDDKNLPYKKRSKHK